MALVAFDPLAQQSIALIGMMGAGKSTVGRILSAKLERTFLDSDAEIEARTGKSVAEIFRDNGEAAFREWEADAVREAIERPVPVVIGDAGGAVLREETQLALKKSAHVVWLRAPIDVLVKRVLQRHLDRPLIADHPEEAMRTLYAAREPIYSGLANTVIDVDAMFPDDIANEIIERLK